MAGITYTYTMQMSASPKGLHAGLNVLPFDLNSGANKWGTLSDTWLLGKIPNGALITDVDIRFGAELSAATHCALLAYAVDALGTLSAIATLIGSMTAAATAATFSSRVPVKISLSDDRATQFVVLGLNCTTGASGSVSFSFQGSVKFLSDGTNL